MNYQQYCIELSEAEKKGESIAAIVNRHINTVCMPSYINKLARQYQAEFLTK